MSLIVVALWVFCGVLGIDGTLHRRPPQEKYVVREVGMFLYHSSNFSYGDRLFVDDVNTLERSRFNPQVNTVFIIHGWTHKRDSPWVIEMREATASIYGYNVIVVDWAPLSHAIYTEARIYTPLVGKQVGKLCTFLAKYKNYPMAAIHFVGHSMGGQISAVAGHYVQKYTGQSVGRITGLDPASPLYEYPYRVRPSQILDKDDALFVDVIHTNARHLGMLSPAGHVDYYPNGGENQPGCGFWFCSHMRACEYWIASIKKPDLFRAYAYKSWDEYLEVGSAGRRRGPPVPMGMAATPRIPPGLYFLETNNDEKYFVVSKTTIADSL